MNDNRNEEEYLVSVVVPIHNAEKYLERCLKSILSQTNNNLQIILVNDGSNDRSGEICQDYKSKHSNICLISIKESQGVSSARNMGLSKAVAPYVMFVDADDWIDRTHVSSLLNLIYGYKDCVLACSGIRYTDGRTTLKCREQPEIVCCEKDEAVMGIGTFKAFFPSVWNKLFRTDIAKTISFPEGVTIGEDYTFVMRYLIAADGVVAQAEGSTYNYFQHSGSACHQEYGDRYNAIINNYRKLHRDLIQEFPQEECDITHYHVVQLMGAITAMERSGTFNWSMARKIQHEVRSFLPKCICSHGSIFEKCAMVLCSVTIGGFALAYRLAVKEIRN